MEATERDECPDIEFSPLARWASEAEKHSIYLSKFIESDEGD